MLPGLAGIGGFVASADAYDADALAYFAAMSVQPDATRKGLLNDLIVGLKADGLWTKLGWLCVIAAHDAQAARLNAKNPAKSLAASGGPTFTTDRGYTCESAASKFLSTGELSTDSGVLTQDSASVGAWINQESVGNPGQKPAFGEATGSPLLCLKPDTTANGAFQVDDGTSASTGVNNGSRLGHWAVSRTASNVKRAFLNGTRTANLSTASTGVAPGIICVGRNGIGSISDDRFGFFWLGSGFSDTEQTNMDSRARTYLTAVGGN